MIKFYDNQRISIMWKLLLACSWKQIYAQTGYKHRAEPHWFCRIPVYQQPVTSYNPLAQFPQTENEDSILQAIMKIKWFNYYKD